LRWLADLHAAHTDEWLDEAGYPAPWWPPWRRVR
jgi:hypothetical protein